MNRADINYWLSQDPKQVLAMAKYGTDAARQRLDNAIDAEEQRDELIAQRAQEIELQRIGDMAPIDVICGMQSALENAAGKVIREHLLAGDLEMVGLMVRTLVHGYIKDDSEVIATEWMERIDAEVDAIGRGH